MSYVTDTQDKLGNVARKIQKVNPSATRRLLNLSAAVGRTPNSMADAWAANDIHRMIDAHVIAEQIRAKDITPLWLRGLEWFRNLLIFIPLVLTWFGISNAVSSYAAFINAINSNAHADKTQLTQPFLYLWQEGFGGYLPGWLVLSRLAFLDFLMLFLLVLLTAVVNIRSHLRTSQKEQEAELLQEELTDALADAALCLTERRGQQPMDAVDIARHLLDELEKERQRLDVLSTRREKELADLKAFTDALMPISQSMINGGMYIQQSTDKLTQVLQSVTGPIQQLATDQRQLLGGMGQTIHMQNSTTQDVKQLVTDVKSWGIALDHGVTSLGTAIRDIGNLSSTIHQLAQQMGGFVNQLGVEHQAQATISQMTANASTGLQEALRNIHQASTNLGSMSKDFYDIMNTQKAFPDAVKASLNDVIRDYTNASASVAQGGNNLAYAARMLFDVANRLNGNGVGVGNGQVRP